MDLKSMVEIGGKVEVIIDSNSNEDEVILGYSMIQDVSKDNELILTLPTFEGYPILLSAGDSLQILFFRKEGIYSFTGKVLNRFRIKNALVVSIMQISSIVKTQRREFYRLNIVLPISFRIIGDKGKKSPPQKGYSIDISGGGLRLNSDANLVVSSVIECNIPLYNEKRLIIKGKVVRIDLANNLRYRYDIGISFYDISHYGREALVKFIFRKQRELRKKGFI